MNSRERVLCTLNHQEPDRIPLDLWGCDSRLLNEFYFRLLRHLGLEGYGEIVRPGRTAEYVDYRISDLIGADFRHPVIRKPRDFQARTLEDGSVVDEWGVASRKIGQYTEVTLRPLAGADIADIARHPWPKICDPGRIEGLAEQSRDWYEKTDFAITPTTPLSGMMLEFYQYLRGTEEFFMDLYMNPEFADALIEKITDLLIELYVFFITPIAPYIAWVEYASDFGMQDRSFLSPELFRRFLKKPYQRIFDAVREVAPHAKVFLHTCGSVRSLIPDFIDMGVDILSALQPKAAGMNSAELKREFGNDLVFHGGIDIQGALCGTLDEAVAETRRRIADYAPGGGYICAPSNHFLDDIPVENFLAMYETAREFGQYPLKRP
jgi:uroporphyrinogen decarboxylase